MKTYALVPHVRPIPMTLCLHNPASQAHIEDLKDRLSIQLALVPADPYKGTWARPVIDTLTEVVRAMDQGALSTEAAQAAFAQFCIPGFSFARWLDEMVEEGVYLETSLRQVA